MPKPSINATIEDLQRQMAKGGQSGSSSGSAGNIMPGPSAISSQPARGVSGGATGGIAGNPARGGNPPISSVGSPMGTTTRDHALTLASTTHLAKMGHPHPQHHQIRAMAQAGIKALKANKGPASSAPRKFGALGGAGGTPGGMSPMNSNMDDDGY